MNRDELIHYGILGMKWGVRRTPAQLARARGVSKTTSSNNRKSSTSKTKSSTNTKKKSVSEMSDEELNRAVRRLQLEKQYRELSPKQVSLGKKVAKAVVKDVVVPAATEVSRNALKEVMNSAIKNAKKKK